MGTRADFYVGRGEDAEWLGSIAWDGDPEGEPAKVTKSKNEQAFRNNVAALALLDDWTPCEAGWPWPWNDSRMTDFAYAFDGGEVWISNYGSGWIAASYWTDESVYPPPNTKFPDMSTVANVQAPGSLKSGTILIGPPDQSFRIPSAYGDLVVKPATKDGGCDVHDLGCQDAANWLRDHLFRPPPGVNVCRECLDRVASHLRERLASK